MHTGTSGSCYKQCGGVVASYGTDSFGTMVCKCVSCGYNYTYSRDVPGVEQIGANGNNNYPNSALGGCIRRILICTKNSTYIDSFTVGDMTFYSLYYKSRVSWSSALFFFYKAYCLC